MRAYYGSRFSPNMTATPEGFLIAHNVPIARTGWYQYLADEIGLQGKDRAVVQVYRSPAEVFSPAAMASFEGKPVTDDHPFEQVTPDNATRHTRGAVQNVRQGSGGDSDLLLADLVIYDQGLINEIQAGKREVSCGYDCVYEPMDDGQYQQKQICGNHVAVVQSGRAGDRVAIKDSHTQLKQEGEKKMSKIKLPRRQSRITDFLAAMGLKQFALDADPEEIREAVDAMAEEREMDDDDEPAAASAANKETNDEQDPAVQALAAKVDQLTDVVSKLVAVVNPPKPESPEDALDDAINELEGQGAADDDEEESHTIPAENFDDEGPVTDPEDRPKPAMTGDNALRIDALKAIKPIIAAIPDPVQRKRAVDAALASIKRKPAKGAYAAIDKGRKKAAADKQKSADSKQVDHSQLGREIAKKYNPHYKERA